MDPAQIMTMDTATIWTIILAMGLGTFLLRLSFLGLIGGRALPDWLLRLLRYTPMAVIPGLMAPQIFLPVGDAALPDPLRLTAVAITLGVGLWRRNAIWALATGFASFAALTWAFG